MKKISFSSLSFLIALVLFRVNLTDVNSGEKWIRKRLGRRRRKKKRVFICGEKEKELNKNPVTSCETNKARKKR